MDAHFVVEPFDVGVHHSATGPVGHIDDLRQVQLDPATLTMRCARRCPEGPFDAVAANLFPDLGQIL
jgi:hypothetical protein